MRHYCKASKNMEIMEIELRKTGPRSGFPHTNATREYVERRGRVVGMSAGEEIRSCGNWARVVVVPRRGVGFLLVLVLEEQHCELQRHQQTM